jgi:hypothetical protein
LIPGITEFIGGAYSSEEGLNQGYTHAFIMTFENAAARDNYLSHAEHERIKGEVVTLVQSIIAFDFEAG